MNKFAIISFLLVGVALLSSSSTASPTFGITSSLQNILSAAASAASPVPLGTTVVQSAGVATLGVVNTVLTNPTLITPQDLLPQEGQILNFLEEAALTPGGAIYTVKEQLKPENINGTLQNPSNIVQNFNASNPLNTVERGAVIGSGADANSAGGLGLPTYTLCPLALQYDLTSCVICNQDCYVAHNLWGGKCGASPITGGPTCLCGESQEDADDRNITTNSEQTCNNVYNPVGNPEQLIIAAVFRVRSIALQCISSGKNENGTETFDSNGCEVDCSLNHGYDGGVCEYQYPNVDNSLYLTTQKKLLFCICTTNGVKSTDGPSSPIDSPTTTTEAASTSTTSSTAAPPATSGY